MKFYALYDDKGSRHADERLQMLSAACERQSVHFVPVDVSRPSHTWPVPREGDAVFAVTRGCYFAEPLLIKPGIKSIYKTGYPFLGYDSDTTVFSAYLEGFGIPSPKTIYVDGDIPEFATIVDMLNLPFIFKETGLTNGQGVHLIHSPAQWDSLIANRSQYRFLLREYIQHDIVWRVAIAGGRIIDIAGKKVNPLDFKSSTSFECIVHNPIINETITRCAINAADKLNLQSGGLDIIETHEKKAILLEYNLRFDFTGHPQKVSDALVKSLCG